MKVRCELCPKYCTLQPGQSGECRVRVNVQGQLQSVVYGYPCTLHNDPIEKKPLFHFLPGSQAFSVATVGCNLHCLNCQNWQISQTNPENSQAFACPPADLVSLAREAGASSIAYTYTDPVVFYEYVLDTAKLAREAGLRNILVTAAYINEKPWQDLLPFMDAANIDLKSMSEGFYHDICGASLRPVLEAIIAAKVAGVWLEVTNLVIPTLNDNPSQIWELANWMRKNLGSETPLHFSGFYPQHKMKNIPPTPLNTLERARRIARAQGLKYVYIGNVMSDTGQNTLCPDCETGVIKRSGYRVLDNRMAQGCCSECGTPVQGIWL